MSAKRKRYIWQRAVAYVFDNVRVDNADGSYRLEQGPAIPTEWANMPKAPPVALRNGRDFRRVPRTVGRR